MKRYPRRASSSFAMSLVEHSPVVDQIQQTVDARLRELQPLVVEFNNLQRLKGVLVSIESSTNLDELPDLPLLLAQVHEHSAVAESEGTASIRRSRRGTKPGRDGRAPQGANKQLILKAILARPGTTAPQIARATGLKRTVVAATINRLKRKGELEAHGDGVRVPPALAAETLALVAA